MGRIDAETLDMVISTLREYAGRELKAERLLELDRLNEFPEQVHRDLYGDVGLHLLFIPEEFGGMGGGAHDIYRVSEVLARIDLGIATSVLATFLGTDPITVGGTPEQKQKWMGRIAREGLLVAYGATEPQAGSDLTALRTSAKPIVHEGRPCYALDGRKQWISNGGVAAMWLILANAPRGASWFVVERGNPGLTPGKHEDKHGIRASNTTSLFLDNAIVPAENLVGGVEGQGLAQAQAVFGYTRLMVAAFGLGGGWSALERAVRYAQERVVGGGPLIGKQGFTHKLLVPNAVRLEAARAFIEWTAERLDGGEEGLATEGAIAKYLATEAGNRAAEDAIQALGGNGYTREYLVEKIKRDVRITTIYEGTSEILEWTTARDRWQLHLKSRGAHYLDWAQRAERLHAERKDVGADNAAIALRSLAAVMERCRADKLTRHQHVLFRLGELVAQAEGAAVFAERAATAPTAAIPLPPATIATMSRVFAREAAARVAFEGARWATAAGQTDTGFLRSIDWSRILAGQAGGIEDMDVIAGSLAQTFPA
ncbi:MAG TPA: acyl-CoA dehydrogenase family protein [Anaeromyxobacteraceae bacterium]|nr:acyl-CoA dehydrogenase family protein [Anaeromyxobacteraceae bacterium]